MEGRVCSYCGLEVSSWFVWLVAGQKEYQGNSGWLRGEGRAPKEKTGLGFFFSLRFFCLAPFSEKLPLLNIFFSPPISMIEGSFIYKSLHVLFKEILQ
jgi:hypothetical protein